MLLELRIKSFALIDKIEIRFSKGFNVLTGETGTGKSILIDSINFILGDKQSKDIIRAGEESAYVEGVFEMQGEEIASLLTDNGIEPEDIIIISREMNKSGRSTSRINGKAVTMGFLKQVGKYLVDIHGQHEHQSLLNEDTHIGILDSFCDESFKKLIEKYLELYNTNKEIERDIQRLSIDDKQKLRRIDLLTFQINEIEAATLKQREDEELSKKRDILFNSEKIYTILSDIYERLYGGTGLTSVYDEIGKSITNLESIVKFDENLLNKKEELEDVYYKLEYIVEGIRDYKSSIEFNSEELEQVEIRLDMINNLKRKYGSSIEDILKYYDEAKMELSNIQRSEKLLDELNKKRDGNNKKLIEMAKDITRIRKKASEKLENMITKELKYLGMEKAIFKVRVDKADNIGPNGEDRVFFLMTANPGEPLKSLSKVASGGEMSRIMLAIKSVIADIDKIPTLIFDEIDIGISGRTAQAVAEKMYLISRSHQILCVTHLPQIASMADNHFQIQKMVKDNKTTTNVHLLEKNTRVDELARMLGGAVLTEITRNHAKEVIELADGLKNKIKKIP